MIANVNSLKLKDAFFKILGVVDKKNTRPILTNCLVEVSTDRISFYATDLEVSAKISIPADVEKPGTFCINAKNIFDITKELPEAEVKLSVTEGKLYLNCLDINYELVTISPDEFPTFHFPNEPAKLSIKGEQLGKIINRTIYAISNDETRYNLNGIFIQEVNSKLRAVATDGHVLALVENENLNIQDENLLNGIIIPRKGVSEIKKITDAYSTELLNVHIENSFIYFSAGEDYYLSIRLIARDYPKYQAVIPNKITYSMNVDKDQFLGAIKRIKILANEKSHAIRISLNSNEMVVSANHPSLGHAKEKIEIDYAGKEIEIGFNAKYLIDTFSAIDSTDLTFEFNNEFSPIILKSSNTPDFMGIVMPLRL